MADCFEQFIFGDWDLAEPIATGITQICKTGCTVPSRLFNSTASKDTLQLYILVSAVQVLHECVWSMATSCNVSPVELANASSTKIFCCLNVFLVFMRTLIR